VHCSGRRHSGLVEELGGPDTPGVGFGIGLERLILLLNEEGLLKKADPDLDVYVVGIGETTNTASFKLVEAARDAGFVAERDYLNRKP
nr:histidine--tRNA ligase [Bifidobacterium bifidum]